MEYTVKKLGQMAGISSRTLRYYDEIGLLKPCRINSSGYRIYGQAEVDRLQQIMFYRELGMGLESIKAVVTDQSFNGSKALRAHRQKLHDKRRQLDELIANVEKTIAAAEGGDTMNDQEKFTGFKQKLVEDNEERYGREIREKYGAEAVDKSNEKVQGMTQAQYEEVARLSAELMETLAAAFKHGDPGGDLAQKTSELHRRWLGYFWDQYSPQAHLGLAQMYVDDERFTAYYDAQQPGTAAFLRDAIEIYVAGK